MIRSLTTHPGLWIALACGLALKALLLAAGSVSFNADEAIIALMARHINRLGALPIFYYGQSYMGALDAYLVAGSFRLFGEAVLSVRLVQVALFLGIVASTYFAARRLAGSRLAGACAALLVAVPPVMFSTYTTATLGDYVEATLLNNLIFLIGWDLLAGRKTAAGWWFLAGILGGLGWWSMALIVVSLVPMTLLGIWRYFRRPPVWKIAALVIGFLIGALPWLIGTLGNPDGVFANLRGSQMGLGGLSSPLEGALIRVFSLVMLNLPALFGLRPSWSTGWIVLPLGAVAAIIYALVLWGSARRALRRGPHPSLAALNSPSPLVERGSGGEARLPLLSLLGGWALLLALFLISSFGYDPTGRYLMVLWPPLAMLVGDALARLRSGQVAAIPAGQGRVLAGMALGLLVGYNLIGNLQAVFHNPPGLTTQWDLVTHIPNEDDDDLIVFLDSIGATRGYSNYWVAYRLAFLTGERIILEARLPGNLTLVYNYHDLRYLPYSQAVRQADEVVYVTTNNPLLNAEIRARFDRLGVTYRERTLGAYTVFYDLSRRVTPDDLGPFGDVSGQPPSELP